MTSTNADPRATVAALIERFEARDVTALARAISMVENGREGFETLLSGLHRRVGQAHRIGVTGPPGAGKSTLIEALVREYRDAGHTIAVVAVDPTSPFTGGALLGDRIRMERVALDPGVFIRSMASRGGVGGLAITTREVCNVLDAFGFEFIVIETVGVGQSELAIAGSADTTMLVLVPESGDGVQVLKAGVMEIANLYVVNKADRPGADRLIQEVEVMLGLRRGHAYRHVAPHHGRSASGPAPTANDPARWEPPVLRTTARDGVGVSEVVESVGKHRTFLVATGQLEDLRRDRLARHTRDVVERAVSRLVWNVHGGELLLEQGLAAVVAGTRSPYRLAQEIVANLKVGVDHDQA